MDFFFMLKGLRNAKKNIIRLSTLRAKEIALMVMINRDYFIYFWREKGVLVSSGFL